MDDNPYERNEVPNDGAETATINTKTNSKDVRKVTDQRTYRGPQDFGYMRREENRIETDRINKIMANKLFNVKSTISIFCQFFL